MSAMLGVKEASLAVVILTARHATSPQQGYRFARRGEVSS